MPNFGPWGCTTPVADHLNQSVYCTLGTIGPLPPGTVRSLDVSVHATFAGGRNDARWFVNIDLYDAAGVAIRRDQVSNQSLAAPDVHVIYTPDIVAARIDVGVQLAAYAGQNLSATASGSWTAAEPCAHGTRLQPAANFVYYLTPGLIDTWCVADGMPWLAPVFTALWFSTIDAQKLCGEGPPPMPQINLGTLEASIATLVQLLQVIAWPNLCECVPGTPAPVPYPPPTATQPIGWPAGPTWSCDPDQICATLVQIQQQLAAIQAAVGEDLGLTTLIQRYKAPFAYVFGAVHSHLTGAGSFPLPRCVGVLVKVTQIPPDRLQLPGTPPYVWNLGWMSVSDTYGMLQERRIARESMTWLPEQMQDSTTFGWNLQPGVEIQVVELYAEP